MLGRDHALPRDSSFEGSVNQTKIWEHFQNDLCAAEIAFSARPRYELLAGKCSPNSKVLNVGVGAGGLETILVAMGVDVSCLDPSERSVESLRSRLGLGEKARVGFSQSMPFPDGVFDVVVMSEVLEHLGDEVLRLTLAEVGRVLRRGGRFVGTVPADENLAESQVVCPQCGVLFHRWGHLQSFSEERLRRLLAGQFASVKLSRHYFSDPIRLNWKGRLSRLAKLAAVAAGIRGHGESFFFEALAD